MPQTNLLKTIIPLSIVCAVLVGYQYMGATWTAPTVAAPGNNAAAPINVGTSTESTQIISGTLGVDSLGVFGDMTIASGSVMYVNLICDTTGSNCFIPGSLGGGGSSGAADLLTGAHQEDDCTELGGTLFDTGAGNICRFALTSCPMGWNQYESWSVLGPTYCSASYSPCTTPGPSAWGNPPASPGTCQFINQTRNCRENDRGETNCFTDYPRGTCQPRPTNVGCV